MAMREMIRSTTMAEGVRVLLTMGMKDDANATPFFVVEVWAVRNNGWHATDLTVTTEDEGVALHLAITEGGVVVVTASN